MADVNTILATGYIRSLDKIIGVSFVKQGGTSSQLLAADGSVKTESTMAVGSATSVSTATMAASSTAYLLGTTSGTTGTKITPQFDTQAYISTDSSGNATVVAYKFSGAFSGNATSATTANVATSIKLQNVAQTESYLLMATASTGACVNVYANTGVKYDPTNKVLIAPKFSGAFSGGAISGTSLTLSASLTFTSAQNITWSGGSYLQRIAITDDSNVGTAVFSFQQSTDSGSNYGTLFTIEDDGSVTLGGTFGDTSANNPAIKMGTCAKMTANSAGAFVFAPSNTTKYLMDGSAFRPLSSYSGSTNGGLTVGSSSYPFLSVYACTLYEGGSSLSSKYLGKTANASSATVATSLSTSTAGSSTLPVYFSGGKPVATSTTLGVCITGKAATAGTADNATKAYGKAESALSVSYAATAGSASSATSATSAASAGYAGKVALTATTGTTLYVAVATTTSATSTALYSNAGMIYNASTNNLRASEFSVTSSSTIRYNTTEKCLEFVVI